MRRPPNNRSELALAAFSDLCGGDGLPTGEEQKIKFLADKMGRNSVRTFRLLQGKLKVGKVGKYVGTCKGARERGGNPK